MSIGLAWVDVLGGWGGCAGVCGCGSVCVGVLMHGCVGEWVDVCGVVCGVGLVQLVCGGGVVWLSMVVWSGDVCGWVVCRGRGCGWEWEWECVDGRCRGLKWPRGWSCARVQVRASWGWG